MALDIKNLFIRGISGLVYIGLIIGAILLKEIGLGILISFFAVLGSYELEKQTLGKTEAGNLWMLNWIVDATFILCITTTIFVSFSGSSFLLAFAVVLLGLRFILLIFENLKNPLKSISIFAFSIFYVLIPLLCLNLLLINLNSPWALICLIAMIWINDTGAYLVGCSIGKHKMFPRVSPQKSWEGLIGGVLFNIGTAFIYTYCFKLNILGYDSSIIPWIIIGISVSVFSTLGDLFESMIKRSLQIKDFGNIMPGHGGILDRIDSLLFVAPALSFIISFLNF